MKTIRIDTPTVAQLRAEGYTPDEAEASAPYLQCYCAARELRERFPAEWQQVVRDLETES
jgi:hypothetical protein